LLGLTGVTYDDLGMAFQALLFCPDEKTARTVTQVLSELEFTVESCIEPFAAVKKLMSQHFDAIVVDCDNEQNATLLFKSARNSTSNQASLAVAIVEGQAGVAKAFRIGANLVLTKPINVEQSKGTLRVARGLLRKGEPGKPPAPAATAAPAAPAKPAAAKAAPPVRPAPPAIATPRPAAPPSATKSTVSVAASMAAASSGLASDEAPEINARTTVPPAAAPAARPAVNKIAPPATPPAGNFGGGAASAPAPAREAQVPQAPEVAPAATPHQAEDLLEKDLLEKDILEKPAEARAIAEPLASASEPAPTFTFGGANAPEVSDSGRNKILLGVAAAALVAAGLYIGWSQFQGRSSQPASHAPATVSPTSTATPAAAAAPSSAQPVAPKPAAAVPVSSSQPATLKPAPATNPDDSEPVSEEDSAPAAASAAPAPTKPPSSAVSSGKPASAAKPAEAPLVVKGGAAPPVHPQPTAPDTPAPNVTGIAATGSGGALSGLVGSGDTGPTPVLQTLNISQGVSQGLLIKKVQPTYPKNAMAMHIEGTVELTATVSKTGEITKVKVLKGDPQLTRAAQDAVKQWKYKPYLLNGEPVEIQTQVTISFKLPH
jgi:periplasmic protein TonB